MHLRALQESAPSLNSTGDYVNTIISVEKLLEKIEELSTSVPYKTELLRPSKTRPAYIHFAWKKRC